jgi:TPR repeat protein
LFLSPGLTKAEYAVGYFTEMGIGCRRDPLEANVWYVRAADAGDERAKHRLAAIRAAAAGANPEAAADPKRKTKNSPVEKASGKTKGAVVETGRTGTSPKTSPKDEKDCIVM